MADDIKIKLGLEADELLAGLRRAVAQLESLVIQANKTEKSIEQIDDAKINLDTSGAQKELDSLGKKADDVANEGIDKAGFWGATLGGALGTVGGMGIQALASGAQMLGSKIMEGALAADEFGDSMEVAFRQQGITDIEGEMEKVRTSTLNLANDLGLPTERTRELASRVANMGGIAGEQAEQLTKLSAGLEVFSGGAVKGEAVALAFSKGIADPEGAAAIEKLAKKYPQLADTLRSNIDPAEKMKQANLLLGESFKTVAEQQGDAGGALNKLSNTMNEAFQKVGSEVYDAIGPIVSGLMPILEEGIPSAMRFMLDIFSSAKTIIGDVFGGAEGPAVDFRGILSSIADVLRTYLLVAFENLMSTVKVVWDLLVYAFEEISKALQPLISNMGGLDGIGKAVTATFDFLLSILEPIGKFLIDVLVFAIDLVVAGFNGVINTGKAVYNFFVNLNAIGAGVGAMFKSIASTIGELVNAITNFRWDQIGSIISGGFSNAKDAYNSAYNAAKAQQNTNNEVTQNLKKNTSEQQKEIDKQKKGFEDLDNTTKTKGGAPKPKGDAKKPAETEVQEIKRLYQELADELETKYSAELILAGRRGEDVKALEEKQNKERSAQLNTFLNERLGKIANADAILSKEDISVNLKPKTPKKDLDDLFKFYSGEIKKNEKGLTAKVSVSVDTKEFNNYLAQIKQFQSDYSEAAKEVVTDVLEFVKIPTNGIANAIGELFGMQTEYASEYTKALGENEAKLEAYLNRVSSVTSEILASNEDAIKKLAEIRAKAEQDIADIQSKGGTEAQAKITVITEELQKKETEITEFIKQNNTVLEETRVASERQIASAKIKSIADVEERKTRLELFNLQVKYEEDIKKAGANATEKLELTRVFEENKKKIEDEYALRANVGARANEAIKGAFLQEFSTVRIEEERRLQEQLKTERDKALADEEKSLQDSLASRSLSFDEYATQVSAINSKRLEEEESKEDKFVQKLKRTGDAAASAFLKSQSEAFAKQAEGMTGFDKQITEFASTAIGKFGELASSGTATLADFGKATAGIAFDTVAKMIPSFVTGILGSSVVQLGPILGPLASAALTASLYGLLALARSAVGLKDGAVSLDGPGSETSDSIPAWLSRGESVITAQATKHNRSELEWMNKTGKSISEYYLANMQLSNKFVDDDGQIVEELRRLREETRGLGTRINRNTKIEVHGVLSGDSSSINAIIDSNRKRNMRRG